MNVHMTIPAQRRPSGAGDLRARVASYPHLTACEHCREYVDRQTIQGIDPATDLTTALAAVLAFHEGAHLVDPLMVASRHFF